MPRAFALAPVALDRDVVSQWMMGDGGGRWRIWWMVGDGGGGEWMELGWSFLEGLGCTVHRLEVSVEIGHIHEISQQRNQYILCIYPPIFLTPISKWRTSITML
jgi:hypothetical protein